jgi:acetyl esterase/lipase
MTRMPLPMDPAFRALLDADTDPSGRPDPLPAVDPLAMRAVLDELLPLSFAGSEPAPDVSSRDFATESDDGAAIHLRWYEREGSASGAAAIYVHGGGMVAGSVDAYDPFVRQHVQWTGVPMLAVEYRRAPEATDETPARDVLAALRWLHGRAAEFGVDPTRVAIMGDSGGGGIAAGVAILARDQGIPLARQILVFPMLDDRTIRPDPHLDGVATWTHDDNLTGWAALLGDRRGTDDVSPVAAPARLVDAAGLAPAYLEVGTLDLFRDETIDYARKLLGAGVEAELHVHPGAPHGYDSMAPEAALTARWKADRIRVLTSL